jgi:protein phosphatase
MLVGPVGAGKTAFAQEVFVDDEILSYSDIQQELTGDFRHQHSPSVVFNEFCHRLELKLSMGERVVADSIHLRKKDRMRVAQIGARFHVPVIYIVLNKTLDEKKQSEWESIIPGLVGRQEQQFNDQLTEILSGDGMATVIDTRVIDQSEMVGEMESDIEIAKKINFYDFANDIKNRGFQGIGLISDVHGMAKDFHDVIQEAREQNLFIVQMGNLVNYGVDSMSAVDQMYHLIVYGNGVMLIGDCETDLEKWLHQHREGNVRMKVNPGLAETIEQFERQPKWKQEIFAMKFSAIMNHSRHHIVFENGDRRVMLVHAACSEKMWSNVTNRFTGFEEYRATLGEFDRETFQNTFHWLEGIPGDHDVYVGHNHLSSDQIVVKTNSKGGRAFFVDTGSSKVLDGLVGSISLTEILLN